MMAIKKITRREEVISLFKKGYSPKEIAQKIDRIRFERVMDFLYMEVGNGNLKKSDIWFSINHNMREMIEKCRSDDEVSIEEGFSEFFQIYESNKEEFKLYIKLEKARAAHGDMYELISEIELLLHRAIKNILIKTYGIAETEWWEKGIPLNIRQQCFGHRNNDDEPSKDPYCYITFINLKDIFDKQWIIFTDLLPDDLSIDRKGFLRNLIKINNIRNLVMHPSKGYDFKPKDFDFIYEFHATINKNKWPDKEVLK